MDATEVTNDAYGKWLAQSPSTAGQPAYCSFNTTFAPTVWPVSTSVAKQPVVNVDWCDARAYCTAQGKRLCGRIGGGTLPWGTAFIDATQSEWFCACSDGGMSPYPYGMASANQICNGQKYVNPSALIDVGSDIYCHGNSVPYASLFDLAGNAAEWEDDCSASASGGDSCRRRGGSFANKQTDIRCDLDDSTMTRSSADANTGFRCCGG